MHGKWARPLLSTNDDDIDNDVCSDQSYFYTPQPFEFLAITIPLPLSLFNFDTFHFRHIPDNKYRNALVKILEWRLYARLQYSRSPDLNGTVFTFCRLAVKGRDGKEIDSGTAEDHEKWHLWFTWQTRMSGRRLWKKEDSNRRNSLNHICTLLLGFSRIFLCFRLTVWMVNNINVDLQTTYSKRQMETSRTYRKYGRLIGLGKVVERMVLEGL